MLDPLSNTLRNNPPHTRAGSTVDTITAAYESRIALTPPPPSRRHRGNCPCGRGGCPQNWTKVRHSLHGCGSVCIVCVVSCAAAQSAFGGLRPPLEGPEDKVQGTRLGIVSSAPGNPYFGLTRPMNGCRRKRTEAMSLMVAPASARRLTPATGKM
jgi:hypothetical protein